MRYINYSRVLNGCEKALKALDCDLAVKEQLGEPERAYAMLTTIDAAALHRRIEVTSQVASHDKSQITKTVYGTLFLGDPGEFDVMLAERLCELIALLQVVEFGQARYAITKDHLAAAAALTSATLAANTLADEDPRQVIDMVIKAKALSDSANRRLHEFLPG